MAKIARYNGDVRAFGSTATGTDRTIFGDVTQSDTLDANLNANFLTGWGILTAGAKPPKQYFNGVLYTATQFIAYLHEVGIPEWNTSQKYYIGSRTLGSDGVEYSSVTGTDPSPNTGTNPATVTDEAVWKIASNPFKEGIVTYNITVDADYTLTALQNKYGRIKITDTGVILTTARNIIIDNVSRSFIAVNDTLQTLTFKTAAGTGIAVLPGRTYELLCDGTDVIVAIAILDSGAFTPVLTAAVNIDSLTTEEMLYSRSGDIVTCSGYCVVDATATGAFSFYMTLPIASNLATVYNVAGLFGNPGFSLNGTISADVATDRALFNGITTTTGASSVRYSFQCKVI